MTDHPDIEAVARAISPMAFHESQHAPRGLEGARPFLLKARQMSMKSRARREARAAIECLIRRWIVEAPEFSFQEILAAKAKELEIEL